MKAIEFGELHESCEDAMEARRALGPEATQADWWKACDRGDWLIWQLNKVGQEGHPCLARAVERIVARAIRRGVKSIRGVRAEWATEYRRWARGWLSGEDRSDAAARVAARAAAGAAARAAAWAAAWVAAWAAGAASDAAGAAAWVARAAELKLQAQDIRREIPEWDEAWEVGK